jgi:hypothetical protein
MITAKSISLLETQMIDSATLRTLILLISGPVS